MQVWRARRRGDRPNHWRVTHLVVPPHKDPERPRFVPAERARVAGSAIALDFTTAEINRLEPLHEVAYLRLGELPVDDPHWDVGVQDMLGLPYYQGIEAQPIEYDPLPREGRCEFIPKR